MNTVSKIIISAVAALAVSNVAFSETKATDDTSKHEMKKHGLYGDTNGDGVVTKDEAMAKALKRFEKMDANGDGQITKEEMMAAHKKHIDGKKPSCKDKK